MFVRLDLKSRIITIALAPSLYSYAECRTVCQSYIVILCVIVLHVRFYSYAVCRCAVSQIFIVMQCVIVL